MPQANMFDILTIVLVTLSVACLIWGAGRLVEQRRTDARLTQLTKRRGIAKPDPGKTSQVGSVSTALQMLSQLSVPEEGWQSDAVKLRFIRAGLRNENMPRLYFSLKTILTFLMPAAVAALLWLFGATGQKILICALVLAAVGYYGPDLCLKLVTNRRAAKVQSALPDLIDLLVISSEAGLSLDAALNRVSREMARSAPALAEEFYLAALEIRAGAGRPSALKNLAKRIHIDDLYGLVSMLVQADKFGTGLADALRIQADLIRTKRVVRAEEEAAKIPTKILLPLILLIFPAMMIVLLGPAIIQTMQAFDN